MRYKKYKGSQVTVKFLPFSLPTVIGEKKKKSRSLHRYCYPAYKYLRRQQIRLYFDNKVVLCLEETIFPSLSALLCSSTLVFSAL